MDFEQALELLQALHRHIEELNRLQLQSHSRPEFGTSALTDARDQATKVVDQMLLAGNAATVAKAAGLDVSQVPHLFGQPETAK